MFNTDSNKPLAHRVDIIISPNWLKIARKMIPGVKTEKDAIKFFKEYSKLAGEHTNGLITKDGLWDSSYHFIEFYSKDTGMRQIWSDFSKTFVREIEMRGFPLGHETDELEKKYTIQSYGTTSSFNDFLVINPEFIGYPKVLPDRSLLDEEKMSEIPFIGEMVRLLIQASEHTHSSMKAIKEFPARISKLMQEHNITYEAEGYFWNADMRAAGKPMEFEDEKWAEEVGIKRMENDVELHTFRSEYFTLSINVEVFNAG